MSGKRKLVRKDLAERRISQKGGFSRKSETVEEGFLVGMVVGNTKIGCVRKDLQGKFAL